MALVRVYCGLASANPPQQLAAGSSSLSATVVDDAGRLLDVCDIGDDPYGYAYLSTLLAERASGPYSVAIAADNDQRLVPALLTTAGWALAYVDKEATDEFSDRFTDEFSEEAESAPMQRRALGLARALHAGALSASQVPARSDLAGLKPVLAAHGALATGRHAAAVALREVLRELYPAALRAYPDPADPVALAVVEALPEPGAVAALAGRSREAVAAIEAVAARVLAAGVADRSAVKEAITALRVAIAEAPRRGGFRRDLTATVAEAVRQSVAAVRACDAASTVLVRALAERVGAGALAAGPARATRATTPRHQAPDARPTSPAPDHSGFPDRSAVSAPPLATRQPGRSHLPNAPAGPPYRADPASAPPMPAPIAASAPQPPPPPMPLASAPAPPHPISPPPLAPPPVAPPPQAPAPVTPPPRPTPLAARSDADPLAMPSPFGSTGGSQSVGNRPVSAPPPPGITPIGEPRPHREWSRPPGGRFPADGDDRRAAGPGDPLGGGRGGWPTAANPPPGGTRFSGQSEPGQGPPAGSRSGWPTRRPAGDWTNGGGFPATPSDLPADPRASRSERPPSDLPRRPEPAPSGSVTPPWQAEDLRPPEPPGLRLVEPTLPGEPRREFGYSPAGNGRSELPPLRLVTPPNGIPRSAPPVSADDDADLLIFAQTRSAWFSGEPEESTWGSALDLGWQAAEQAARQPTVGERTGAGLPRRVPRANLVPGSPPVDDRPLRVVRDPARIAAHTSGYFNGWRRGQEIGGYPLGARQQGAGAWDFSREDERMSG